MPDPTRDFAFASLEVYALGHGDPLVIDRGLGWYDLLSESFDLTACERNAGGQALLELIDGVGLCCRAFVIPQDTRLSHGTATGGTWEERQAATGRNVYRVHQLDSANTVTAWAYAFDQNHYPADPQLAFSLVLPDSPTDWDYTTYPPFIRMEFSNAYGVEFGKDGVFLVRKVAGSWVPVAALPNPPRAAGYGDGDEIFALVRVLAGQVCVSFDFGHSYLCYLPADGPATIPAGYATLRGRGGVVTAGLHQAACYAADYTSAVKELDRARVAAVATFTGSRYDLNGGTVDFADLGSPLFKQAQYRLTLTPVPSAGVTWDYYHTPVVYAVNYRYPRVVQFLGLDKSTPFDSGLVSVRVVKPRALDGATATVVFELNAHDVNSLSGYQWRRCDLILGYVLSNGALESYAAGTFYVAEIAVEWGGGEDFSKVRVTWQLVNLLGLFRQDGWTPFRQFPLGGQTPNLAGDEILYWHGLGASYRSWHAGGSVGVIPLGTPEEPVELTQPEELPWEALQRIMSERHLEVGVDDSNVIFTVPKSYVNPVAGDPLCATPVGTTDVRQQVKRLAYRIDHRGSADGALVYATGDRGQLVFASAQDTAAQTDTSSPRFTPWRKTAQRQLSGTPDAGYVLGHLQDVALDSFQLPREAEISVPVDYRQVRRARLPLNGFAGCGIPDGTEFVVLTLEQQWQRQEGVTSLETKAGLARLDT